MMQSAEKDAVTNALKQLFQKSADVGFQTYTFNNQNVLFILCDGMIDQPLLNEVIIPRVQAVIEHLGDGSFEDVVDSHLHIPDLKKVEMTEEILSLVYTGQILLYFETENALYSSNIANKPNRKPEETKLEVVVKGARDNFIEDISTNIALIRKRLPTNSLCVEKFELGERSKTTVAVLYLGDVANPDILTEIKKQLNNVNTDIVISGDILMEKVNKNTRLFPKNGYTGRPDYVVHSLARGRFIMLVDGVAYAMILPVDLLFLLKSAEDEEDSTIYASFTRLIRVASIAISIFVPAFWLALSTYHQNQLPYLLLGTIEKGNTGLPFPTALEMLLMVLMFEILREAGMRLPTAIGGTISIVGGIIIGDAAIRAGITSPAMVVVIAISTLASFTLVNSSLVTTASILRIFFILASSFLGLFGFFTALYFLIVYLANIRVFGVPYLSLGADLSWSTIKRSLLRLPPGGYTKRPNVLDPKDQTRTKGAKNE